MVLLLYFTSASVPHGKTPLSLTKTPRSTHPRPRIPPPERPDEEADAKLLPETAEELANPPKWHQHLVEDEEEELREGRHGVVWSVMVSLEDMLRCNFVRGEAALLAVYVAWRELQDSRADIDGGDVGSANNDGTWNMLLGCTCLA